MRMDEETLGQTRLGTAWILTLADNGSESADDETDEEVNELIRGDNETSHQVDGDWRELRNKINKLLAEEGGDNAAYRGEFETVVNSSQNQHPACTKDSEIYLVTTVCKSSSKGVLCSECKHPSCQCTS